MAGIRSQKSFGFSKALLFLRKDMKLKKRFNFTNTEQQIEKLKSQQLTFQDEVFAKEVLKTYGYYNIINGYREPYIIPDDNQKIYYPNTVFEQIYALFRFDHTLRNSVLLAMIDLEEHLKAVLADTIADSFGTDYNIYLGKNNYRDKYVSDPKFRRNSILKEMKKVAEFSYKQPIKYYREAYNEVPPWILFKGVFFGTTVNFIRILKSTERSKLIRALYSDKIPDQEIETLKDILSDTLFMCLEYRNLAAHGGRVYNYTPSTSFRLGNDLGLKKGLPQLFYALDLLQHKTPFQMLHSSMTQAVNEYCNIYKDSLERLEEVIGFHFTFESQIWVNNTTKMYHFSKQCCGKKAQQMLYSQMINNEYRPCKKCCKDII